MASTDAKPVPQKNVAYRITFPIYDADGDLVTGAAGLDSEVSIDGAAFADVTAEATEIGSSGIYYLDLTAAEMNGDTIAVQTKTSTTGAKTAVTILYPEEAGDIRVNVTQISGDATAADNLESAADGTGYNLGGGAVVAASVTGAVGSVTGAVGSVTGNVGGNVAGSVGSVTGAVGSVTGNVGGNVTGSIGSLAAQAKADVNAEVDSALDTAVPGTPTAGSVNERLKTMDDADIPARLPAALVSGRMDASVGAVATDAIGAAGVSAAAANKIADALLDRTSGVETGTTPRQALRAIAAAAAGDVTGGGTGSEIFKGVGVATTRLTSLNDSDGNRTVTPALS